ncbi:GTP-binding protein [candidate division KSB1 bacterium]|nr:GTP-binding protein [candidate division KSB1 bacterium]
MNQLLLVGNPNVGKSAIFSRLTGVKVIAANYPGTTVEYTTGYMRLEGEKIKVIDVPGAYSLEAQSKAEQVALDLVAQAEKRKDITFINILDSTNLERNLNLTFDLIEKKIPIILVLNFWDEANHTGVSIDTEKLEQFLGIPVVTTCGVTGEGIKELVSRLPEAKPSPLEYVPQEKWLEIGRIVSQVQTLSHRHHTMRESLEEASIHPFYGIPIAALVLLLSFLIIRFIGESLISWVFDPFFHHLWAPLVEQISGWLQGSGIVHEILVGNQKYENIEYLESLGLLTTGLYVPIAVVLPYIFAFYLVLGFLEDLGYLPRLGILLDSIMHFFGLHGLAIIPMFLGLGCNVPGALATRILETRKEKFIAATMMAIAVPCMAQLAMIMGLIGPYGPLAGLTVFASLFVVWVVLGILLHRILKGESPEIFVEIPPYRFPYIKALAQKLWLRMIHYIREAVPFVLLGVLIVNLLYSLHIIDFFARIIGPTFTTLLGLPPGAVGALIIGFLRKDVAVGMLIPLGLNTEQAIIASVVLVMYFPCIATFSVMIRELGLKDMLKATLVMILSTIIVGSMLNLLL